MKGSRPFRAGKYKRNMGKKYPYAISSWENNWEDAVPGKPERNEKMDTEIPQLGSGTEPTGNTIDRRNHSTTLKT